MTQRWIRALGETGSWGESPRVDAFLKDIEKVCRKHQMCLSHEDKHGSFEVCEFYEENIKWLNEADDCRQADSL